VPTAPAGVPAWAFLQTEDLKRVRKFIEWWIDNRQVATATSAAASRTMTT
jgi:hypothetical protein